MATGERGSDAEKHDTNCAVASGRGPGVFRGRFRHSRRAGSYPAWTIGSISSRSLRRPHISLMIVMITPGVLRVDSPLVRGK